MTDAAERQMAFLFALRQRGVMDKRVLAHFDGDVTRANIQPGKREKYLARYPRPDHVVAAERQAEQDAADAAAAEVAAQAEVMAARCPGCGYTYEVEVGNELEGFAAGTAWSEIPDDWCCPDCGVREKVDFVALDPSARQASA